MPPYRLIDYSPLQLGAALQSLPEQVYCFLSPFGLFHFHFTLSHFILVVSPGWLTQVVLCDVIDTPDRPTGGAFDRFVRWTTCNDPLMSCLPISFLIVLCSINTRGPRAILSSVSYPLDHRCAPFSSLYLLSLLPSGPQSCRYRATFGHSLCPTRFIVTALNRLWALRSSDFALYRFIHTFWSPICCPTPFWPHPIAATSSSLLSLPFLSSHIVSNTFPCSCHSSHTMSDPSFALPSVSPLNNRNYPSWSKEIKAWLRLKGLWLLVSGEETVPVGSKEKPAEAKEVAEWKRNAQKAAGALLLSVEEQFRGVLDGIEDDPIAIWTTLEEQFNKKSAGSRFNAMEDLFRSRSATMSPCLSGKMHAHPFPSTGSATSKPLELVHSDLHGPLPVATHSGMRYWITFIDEFTKLKVVYALRLKSDAFDAFKRYKAYVENLTGQRILALQDDKGGEYMSTAWDSFCLEHGISRRHTARNRPQQNGVAERASCTIMEALTAMLSESHLPLVFWGEALAAYVHVWNRLWTSTPLLPHLFSCIQAARASR